MANLHQYYKEEKWNAFFQNIVPTELEKNIKFYSDLVELNLFPSDINKVLAQLLKNQPKKTQPVLKKILKFY